MTCKERYNLKHNLNIDTPHSLGDLELISKVSLGLLKSVRFSAEILWKNSYKYKRINMNQFAMAAVYSYLNDKEEHRTF
tara:strand:+ start:992 stop:1228 length:237 start_codon:yes stop_codon:yes gene_type:complete